MKTLVSLALLSVGAANAQRPILGQRPTDDRIDRTVEGRYVSSQRDDTIVRTLRLDRNGSVELVTEYRKRDKDRNSRDGYVRMSDRDVETFGRTADEATRGRPVRQAGRWTTRDGRLILRFDDATGPARGRGELQLYQKDDTLVLDRVTDAYGRQRIVFYADRNAPRGGRYGRVMIDSAFQDIDGLDYAEDRDGGRLTIRANGRRIEVRGRSERRGDVVRLSVGGGRSRDNGDYTIRLRNADVVSVTGSGTVDGRRVEFRDDRRP